VIVLPLVLPAAGLAIGENYSMLIMVIELFGPLFYIAVALYFFQFIVPRHWRESERREVDRTFRAYHASEAVAIVFVAAFQLTAAFWVGDPWARENTPLGWIALGCYAAHTAAAFAAPACRERLRVLTRPE
jgi:hypothetical protein